MALHPIEEATLRAFVVPAKRDRWLALFGSAKRRYAQELASPAEVLAKLLAAGAPADCHVISDNPALDGRDLPLAEAVEAAETYPFASILCCLPGQLAFFFDEIDAPRTRILLRRPTKC